MNDFNVFEKLKENLDVCYLNGRKNEIITRCIFCGDSIKNLDKGHLYIQNHPPYKFYCQKCGSAGYLNEKSLKLFKINDFSLINFTNKTYKEHLKSLQFKYGSNFNIHSKPIAFPISIPFDQKFKLKYLEDRVGIKITNENLKKFKIVLSLEKFLKYNKIKLSNKESKYKLSLIEKYCIGFLSLDKTVIVFRSIFPDKTNFRYANLTIFPEFTSKKTYAINNFIDYTKLVHTVHITEGTIDIIGLYNKIGKECPKEDLFFACNGKSFLVVINTLKELGLLNLNINFYSDSDVELSFFKNIMKQSLIASMNGMKIFYNKIGKDYGVIDSEIELSKPIEI